MEVQQSSVSIIDYNPNRMTPQEVSAMGIPSNLQPLLADNRQYAPTIARNFPEGTSWFHADQPWFFRIVMSDEEKLERIKGSNLLILSGSGLSAYKYQEGNRKAISEEDDTYLQRSQEVIRNYLGEGKWVLGICFGGQLAINAIRGRIGRLPNNQYGNVVTEAGWLEHELTKDGREDEVFGFLPDTFWAPHLHSDFVSELPGVGSNIETASGLIKVVESKVLAIRRGYLDREGTQDIDTEYIHACVVVFDNGSRLYHVQPHPEMATREKANFLVRVNTEWLSKRKEMGEEYTNRAKEVPEVADFGFSRIITNFIEVAEAYLTGKGFKFKEEDVQPDFRRYLIA